MRILHWLRVPAWHLNTSNGRVSNVTLLQQIFLWPVGPSPQYHSPQAERKFIFPHFHVAKLASPVKYTVGVNEGKPWTRGSSGWAWSTAIISQGGISWLQQHWVHWGHLHTPRANSVALEILCHAPSEFQDSQGNTEKPCHGAGACGQELEWTELLSLGQWLSYLGYVLINWAGGAAVETLSVCSASVT